MFKRFFVILSLAGLAACSTELKRDLTQNQADEVIVVLKSEGISADKKSIVKNRETTYVVSVSKPKYNQALTTLVKYNLPTEAIPGMQEICGTQEQLVPSPETERCKFLVGKQNDIAKNLRIIDGIIDARVQLNIPKENPLSEKPPRPTASVILKYIPGVSGEKPFDEKMIREAVANAVEDLDFNDVSILATATRYHQVAQKAAPETPLAPAEKAPTEMKAQAVVPTQAAAVTEKSQKSKVFILIGTVIAILLAGGAITTILHSKNLAAENEHLRRRQKQMSFQSNRALKAAPQAVAKAAPAKFEEEVARTGGIH